MSSENTSTSLSPAPEIPPYSVEARPTGPSPSGRLGRTALFVGVGVFVLSITAAVLMGIAAAPYATAGPTGVNVSLNAASNDPAEQALTLAAFAHILIGTGLGLWAMAQGIVAIATNRGRSSGIVAVILAFLAPGVSMATYFGIALTLASS